MRVVRYLLFMAFLTATCAVLWKPEAAPIVSMYWGQDSAGSSHPSQLEQSLGYYCNNAQYDVINMAFMISFVDARQPNCAVKNGPDLNFANHGNNCTTFPNCPFLLDCSNSIGRDIAMCQSKGKKIVLSLGGAVGSYGFTSDSEATSFASTIWDMLFEGSGPLRPFGNVSLDGVDLDIEGGSPVGYGAFVSKLRSLMQASSKDYIISGAPQCPFPDAYMGPATGKVLTEAGNDFSYLNVQFYNNYCSASNPTEFKSAWAKWASAAASGGYKILVGLPSAAKAGGGYISYEAACNIISTVKSSPQFGGAMFWDASWDMINGFYSSHVKACL